MPKKTPSKIRRPRHGWAMNPKTRIKLSKKIYLRRSSRKTEKNWVDELLD